MRLVFEAAGARYVATRVVRRDGKGKVTTRHAGLEQLPPGFDLRRFDTAPAERGERPGRGAGRHPGRDGRGGAWTRSACRTSSSPAAWCCRRASSPRSCTPSRPSGRRSWSTCSACTSTSGSASGPALAQREAEAAGRRDPSLLGRRRRRRRRRARRGRGRGADRGAGAGRRGRGGSCRRWPRRGAAGETAAGRPGAASTREIALLGAVRVAGDAGRRWPTRSPRPATARPTAARRGARRPRSTRRSCAASWPPPATAAALRRLLDAHAERDRARPREAELAGGRRGGRPPSTTQAAAALARPRGRGRPTASDALDDGPAGRRGGADRRPGRRAARRTCVAGEPCPVCEQPVGDGAGRCRRRPRCEAARRRAGRGGAGGEPTRRPGGGRSDRGAARAGARPGRARGPSTRVGRAGWPRWTPQLAGAPRRPRCEASSPRSPTPSAGSPGAEAAAVRAARAAARAPRPRGRRGRGAAARRLARLRRGPRRGWPRSARRRPTATTSPASWRAASLGRATRRRAGRPARRGDARRGRGRAGRDHRARGRARRAVRRRRAAASGRPATRPPTGRRPRWRSSGPRPRTRGWSSGASRPRELREQRGRARARRRRWPRRWPGTCGPTTSSAGCSTRRSTRWSTGASRILRELSGGQYDLTHDKGEFFVVDHHDAGLRRGRAHAVRRRDVPGVAGPGAGAVRAARRPVHRPRPAWSRSCWTRASARSTRPRWTRWPRRWRTWPPAATGWSAWSPTCRAGRADPGAVRGQQGRPRRGPMVGPVTNGRAAALVTAVRSTWTPGTRRTARPSIRARPAGGRPGAESAAELDADVEVPAGGVGAAEPAAGRARPRRGAARRRRAAHRRPRLGRGGRRHAAPGPGRVVRGRGGPLRPARAARAERGRRAGRARAVHRRARAPTTWSPARRATPVPARGRERAGPARRRPCRPTCTRSRSQVLGRGPRRRADADDLLVVDGPLRGRDPAAAGARLRQDPPGAVPAARAGRGGRRRCGRASARPVFLLGTRWHRYTWYLRLPGPAGAPWAGSCGWSARPTCPRGEAIALADLSAVTLPRFASTAVQGPARAAEPDADRRPGA